ncbi:MAG TPA: sigma 54-interacting transcriptional regulator [Thermoanaerobaculia bacterium]|nr:sigma 54-interacting transcriptional regulator [Thermoanaerobaculia bacterium]
MLPRILVIDDLYGRVVDGIHEDRAAVCLQLRLKDETPGAGGEVVLDEPLARAVFCRGQLPAAAAVGDAVENDLAGTLRLIDGGWHERPAGTAPWALVLLDLRFRSGTVTAESEARYGRGVPEGRPADEQSQLFGLRLLEEMQRRYPHLPVIVLSDAPRDGVSRESAALGAVAFLAKGDPRGAEKLHDYLRRHALVPDPDGEIIGCSIPLLVALRNARRAAMGAESILIRGETGTGKELLARYIHRNDPRRQGAPLVVVDSGTLSPELYASELFGHVKGGYTGAISDRPGRIVEAHRGLLFLDEIGNVDGTVQRGLLRVLQEKQVRPVGGTRAREVDVRFVFATNEDIESRAAAEDGFRLDLLERIRQGGTIVLPPLRDRLDDLPVLVEALVREAERVTHGAMRRKIDAGVFDLLRRQSWRGNIRQLRTCVMKAVNARADVEHLVAQHLDLPREEPSPRPLRETPAASALDEATFASALAMLQTLQPGPAELVGQYGALEAAFARAATRYLRACLDAVRKPTLRNPAGEILVQPAVKLMLGEAKLNASQAYDFVIRLRNLSPSVAQEWDTDAVLGPLFEHARAQRRPGRSGPRRTPALPLTAAPLEEAHA